jgi:hypothetical protein
MRHAWEPITKIQKPPRMKCSRCGMVRRWSRTTESFNYYGPKGYIGGRPGPCPGDGVIQIPNPDAPDETEPMYPDDEPGEEPGEEPARLICKGCGYWAPTEVSDTLVSPGVALSSIEWLCSQCEEPAADKRSRERWHAAAICLGFNELAKLGKTLGEKVYHRMMRAGAEEHFVSLGGQRIFQEEPAVVVLTLEDGMPWVKFRACDIELMREAVKKWDLDHAVTCSCGDSNCNDCAGASR